MRRIPVLTILMIVLTIVFIGCSERTAKWVPEEIKIYEYNQLRIYKFLYDKQNRLIGFDIVYTQPSDSAKDMTVQLTDTVRFEYGKDGCLIQTEYVSEDKHKKTVTQNIYYMGNDTIQLDANDSTKTTLLLNKDNYLLRIQTKGYEGGYLYDSDNRVKLITHKHFIRSQKIDSTSFKMKLDYNIPLRSKQVIFKDVEFPGWMLLYYGLEILMYNPTKVSFYTDSIENIEEEAIFNYEYNKAGYPTRVTTSNNKMTFDIKYIEVK